LAWKIISSTALSHTVDKISCNIGDSHSFGEPVGGVMVPGSISKSLSESFILVLSAQFKLKWDFSVYI
jgi:hypothetical protein